MLIGNLLQKRRPYPQAHPGYDGLPAQAASVRRLPFTGQPGAVVPHAVGDQLAEQEHRRIDRRVLPAEHRRDERTGNRDTLGTP
jgi:hypothetical protein